MASVIPIAVVIPTYHRGTRVLKTLEQIYVCDPQPAEIWIHIDQSDGELEKTLARDFPRVKVVSSPNRLGPGGGRHRCLELCESPFAVSFDDDSYPLDFDFFSQVDKLFANHSDAAVIGARIWHRHEKPDNRTAKFDRKISYTGCGYGIRLSAYRPTRGYLPLKTPYAMEETDLALLLFAKGWKIYESSELRVFHDTELAHHQNPETTAGVIAYVGLLAFLHYPLSWWPWGFLQVGNMIFFMIKMRRWKGIVSGLFLIPATCRRFSRYRSPLPVQVISDFIRFRRQDNPSLKKS